MEYVGTLQHASDFFFCILGTALKIRLIKNNKLDKTKEGKVAAT